MGSPRPKQERKLVLLVEDNEDARDIYATHLRLAGYDVEETSCLADAREFALVRRPDAVVLDCRLPDGDGLELLKRWRQEAMMLEVPVVVVTASRARQELEAAVLAGADVFVQKPCPGSELTLHVARALQGNRASARLRRG